VYRGKGLTVGGELEGGEWEGKGKGRGKGRRSATGTGKVIGKGRREKAFYTIFEGNIRS
jgi:hypothetical protein